MYTDKPRIFDAFCWHYDEIHTIPKDSDVLAYNDHSLIQALTFKRDKAEFWGVQYHPEFDPLWISKLMKLRKKNLLDNNIFNDKESFHFMSQLLLEISKKNNVSSKFINKSITDKNIHYLEIKNWLQCLKKSL